MAESADDVEPLLPTSAGNLQGDDDEAVKVKYCWCFNTRRKCVAFSCAAVGLSTTILVLVALFAVAPAVAEGVVAAATLELTSLVMSQPGQDSVFITAKCTLTHKDVPIAATLQPAPMKIEYLGVEVGRVTSPAMELKAGTTSALDIASKCQVTNLKQFDLFAMDMLNKDSLDFAFVGTVSARATVLGVPVVIRGVHINKTVTLAGLSGVPDVTLDCFEVSQHNGSIFARAVASVGNPSVVTINPTGNLSCFLEYQNTDLATAFVPSLGLFPGMNRLDMYGNVPPRKNMSAANALFTRYLGGQPTVINAHGAAVHASSYPLYSQFMSSLSLSATLPGLQSGIGRAAEAEVNMAMLVDIVKKHELHIPVQLLLWNPFGAEVAVTQVDAKIMYNGTEIGYAKETKDMNGHDLNVVVRPNSTSWSPPVGVRCDTSSSSRKALLSAIVHELMQGKINLGIEGLLWVHASDLVIVPYYRQAENIPTCSFLTKKLCEKAVKENPPIFPPTCSQPG